MTEEERSVFMDVCQKRESLDVDAENFRGQWEQGVFVDDVERMDDRSVQVGFVDERK